MREAIRKYLSTQVAEDSLKEVDDTTSLLEAGVLDSLNMVNLINYLENTYGLVIQEQDLTPENFDSIESIANYVTRYQARKQTA